MRRDRNSRRRRIQRCSRQSHIFAAAESIPRRHQWRAGCQPHPGVTPKAPVHPAAGTSGSTETSPHSATPPSHTPSSVPSSDPDTRREAWSSSREVPASGQNVTAPPATSHLFWIMRHLAQSRIFLMNGLLDQDQSQVFRGDSLPCRRRQEWVNRGEPISKPSSRNPHRREPAIPYVRWWYCWRCGQPKQGRRP